MGALKLREYQKPPKLRKARTNKNYHPNPKGVLLLLIAFFVSFIVFNSDNKNDKIEQEKQERNETIEEFAKRATEDYQKSRKNFI